MCVWNYIIHRWDVIQVRHTISIRSNIFLIFHFDLKNIDMYVDKAVSNMLSHEELNDILVGCVYMDKFMELIFKDSLMELVVFEIECF